jgi:hypothetical protein
MRNKDLHVTGALISTFYIFAQLLEGPADSIDALMARIIRDDRHRDLKVISETNIDRRKFPCWSMAYSGTANYIDRHVEFILDSSNSTVSQAEINQLEGLMEEFSKRLN